MGSAAKLRKGGEDPVDGERASEGVAKPIEQDELNSGASAFFVEAQGLKEGVVAPTLRQFKRKSGIVKERD